MSQPPVIITTGASRGLGAAVADWLARVGSALTLTARSAEALSETTEAVTRLGGQALPVAADVADPEAADKVVRETIDRFGRIDAVINNAGILAPIARLADADPAQWGRNIEVNLLGPVYLIQSALPFLSRSGGRVVNVSSGAADKAIPGWSAYCAAKAGLTHLTRVLAAEHPEITAVSIRPGVVDTRMQAEIRERGDDGMTAEAVAGFRRLKADGELEPPAIPARAIAWLALKAPADWSGRFLDYDDPAVATPAADLFGPVPDGRWAPAAGDETQTERSP